MYVPAVGYATHILWLSFNQRDGVDSSQRSEVLHMSCIQSSSAEGQQVVLPAWHWVPDWAIWVCLKIGYIPNYSHLIGIMISKTIGFRGTNLFSDKPICKTWRGRQNREDHVHSHHHIFILRMSSHMERCLNMLAKPRKTPWFCWSFSRF